MTRGNRPGRAAGALTVCLATSGLLCLVAACAEQGLKPPSSPATSTTSTTPTTPTTQRATTSPAATQARTTRASATDAAPVVDRTVRIADLVESSGLAASLRHDGVVWSHNDSGDEARVFAVDADGHDAATVGLQGVASRDAEAIQAVQVPSAGPVLVLADIGDNQSVRSGDDGGEDLPQLVVFPEPAQLRDGTVRPTLRISFSYPDGPHDAETLLADPRDQRLYVLTKAMFQGRLYAVPERVWPGADGEVARRAEDGGESKHVTTELTPVADVPVGLATDGAIGPDGALVVRGYGSLWVFPPVERLAADGEASETASGALPRQKQGESLTLDPDHAGSVLVGSEGSDQPIYRVPLPEDAG